MAIAKITRFSRSIILLITIFSLSLPAYAKYSGGTGEPNTPYQIATAEDLILLGESAEDYDKHFILTADIDLDSNLPGCKVFDRAVIAPDPDNSKLGFQGTAFSGVFDGNNHTISHLTITGSSNLGLFGELYWQAEVRNLGVVDVNITGTGNYIGGLVGSNGSWFNYWGGSVINCYSTGAVSGDWYVGGLIGLNDGTVIQCCSDATVSGHEEIGGLVGVNDRYITTSYSTGAISGVNYVGGLAGINGRRITASYSTSAVSGNSYVGGLVGENSYEVDPPSFRGYLDQCYSTGVVSGNSYVGGLVGHNEIDPGAVINSVWDIETSSQSGSAGGLGLTTDEMMDPYMLGLNGFANDPNWIWDVGRDYPHLVWEGTFGDIIPAPDIDWLEGQGKPEDPYRISTADQLIFLGRASALWDKHFILGADIDLDPSLPGRCVFEQAPILVLTGVFDGNGHVISRMAITGESYLGLFGGLESGAMIKELGVVDVNIIGSGHGVGGLVGSSFGTVSNCYTIGIVSGNGSVGGLVGYNAGNVTNCYSTGSVSGDQCIGGLVGSNNIMRTYGSVTNCYSTAAVGGNSKVGGLVGNYWGSITTSFWDIYTSGQTTSAGGTGKTTAEMQTATTFLEAGWDFVDETENGIEDIWWILEGQDYPKLWWEGSSAPTVPYGGGSGEPNDPYQIASAEDLILLGRYPCDYGKHFILIADINLDPKFLGRMVFGESVIASNPLPYFTGVFDGNGHTISNLTIRLFGSLGFGAEIKNLGVVDVNITGSGDSVGGLVGYNEGGTLTNCYSTGAFSGDSNVGGLVGKNSGDIVNCYSTGSVSGNSYVGGLVGENWGGIITTSYSNSSVNGNANGVGGLVGSSYGSITYCYSTGPVSGTFFVGGLVGIFRAKERSLIECFSTGKVSGDYYAGGLVGIGYVDYVIYCFWDTETSDQVTSVGGTGKSTAEMQTASTFLETGWDFVDETANGIEDIWWIDEGQDYPRLWWEAEGN